MGGGLAWGSRLTPYRKRRRDGGGAGCARVRDKVSGNQTTRVASRTLAQLLPERNAELCATELEQEMKEAM